MAEAPDWVRSKIRLRWGLVCTACGSIFLGSRVEIGYATDLTPLRNSDSNGESVFAIEMIDAEGASPNPHKLAVNGF